MKTEVTAITISHIWDDESQTDISIRKGIFDDTGAYVSVEDDGQTIYLRPESWPEIRDQIQGFFDSMTNTTEAEL